MVPFLSPIVGGQNTAWTALHDIPLRDYHSIQTQSSEGTSLTVAVASWTHSSEDRRLLSGSSMAIKALHLHLHGSMPTSDPLYWMYEERPHKWPLSARDGSSTTAFSDCLAKEAQPTEKPLPLPQELWPPLFLPVCPARSLCFELWIVTLSPCCYCRSIIYHYTRHDYRTEL